MLAREVCKASVGPRRHGKDVVSVSDVRGEAVPHAARRSVEPSSVRLARRLYDAGWSPVLRSWKWAHIARVAGLRRALARA